VLGDFDANTREVRANGHPGLRPKQMREVAAGDAGCRGEPLHRQALVEMRMQVVDRAKYRASDVQLRCRSVVSPPQQGDETTDALVEARARRDEGLEPERIAGRCPIELWVIARH